MSESHTDIERPSDETPVAEPTSGPGHRLRLARERKGLDIPAVAEQLHLPEHLIAALEEDDYAALPGSVFIKGYLRNYARLVDEPVDDILASVRTLHPSDEYQPTFRQGQSGARLRGHRGYRARKRVGPLRILGWLMLLIAAVVLVLWWRGYLDSVATLSLDAASDAVATDVEMLPQPAGQDTAEGQPDTPDSTGSVLAPQSTDAAEQNSTEPLPDSVALGDAADAAGVDAANTAAGQTPGAMEAEASAAAQSESAPSGDDAAGADTQTGAESGSLEPTEQTQASESGEGEVVLDFTAPCWVDIRDADGAKVLYGGIDRGKRHVLAGKPPYSLILGNNSAVNITVAGRRLDTEPYSTGRVARFSLDPEALKGTAVD